MRYDLCWSIPKVDRGERMANSLNDVIKKLEQQRLGIERALAALRDIESPGLETAGAGLYPSLAALAKQRERRHDT